MKKILRALLWIALTVLVVAGLLYASGLIFLAWHDQPLDYARPLSILDYWQTYGDSPDRFVRLSVRVSALLPWGVFFALVCLILAARNRRALYGAARFASRSEVSKAGLIKPKDGYERTILVGRLRSGEYLSYGGYQFVLLAAPTRSGKGVGVVIPNCLNYSDSLAVLDIKGENFDITSGFRRRCGQAVYKFDPFNTEGRTHRYNPLAYISDDPAQRMGDIDSIATALYSGGNQNDKFWSENAKDLFRGLCLLVLETPDIPHTFGEILRQASGKGKPLKEHIKELFEKRQAEGRPYSNACIDCLMRVISNADNTLSGIVATFNTPLLIFQNPRVDLATSGNDFDLRDVRRRRMSLYFVISPNKLAEASVIINLFFDQLLNLNTQVLPQKDKSLKYQCLVLLDEMTAMGRVAMINKAVSYMAGYNMRLLTIIQNRSQLEDVYGKAGATTIISNHALMVMYAPSPTVLNDAKEYSEMLGYQTVKSTSRNSSLNSSSTTLSDQRRALMLPQELRELVPDQEIVSMGECKPIFCKKIRYYEDENFKERANLPVEEPPALDLGLFLAALEKRVRPASTEELKAADTTAAKLPGLDKIPEVPADSNFTDEQIREFVSSTTNVIFTEMVSMEETSDETVGDEIEDMFNSVDGFEASDDEADAESETDEAGEPVSDPDDETTSEGETPDMDQADIEGPDDDFEPSDPSVMVPEVEDEEEDASQDDFNADVEADAAGAPERNSDAQSETLKDQITAETTASPAQAIDALGESLLKKGRKLDLRQVYRHTAKRVERRIN